MKNNSSQNIIIFIIFGYNKKVLCNKDKIKRNELYKLKKWNKFECNRSLSAQIVLFECYLTSLYFTILSKMYFRMAFG